jgi:hypothetical protein
MISLAILGFPLSSASAEKDARPDVPAAIQAGAGEDVVLLAHASGSQIYSCQTAADGKFNWTLKAPEAELADQAGKVIGAHFAGPTWRYEDGSEVTGKAVGNVSSPETDSIPWLLVKAVDHSGNGMLTKVTTIQRVHTQGGKPPAAGCDESHRGSETKSHYTADYYFYAPAK